MMKFHASAPAALLAGALLTLSTGGHAAQQVETTTNTFRVTLGVTRVVYPEKASGAQVSVSNGFVE